MKKVVILYAPALHQGYINFLNKHEADPIFVVTEEIRARLAKEVPYFGRDIRMILSSDMVQIFSLLQQNPGRVRVLNEIAIAEIKENKSEIIMPEEDISHKLYQEFFPNHKVSFESVFLRWDRLISTKENEINPNRVISEKEFDKEIMQRAVFEGQKSSDWWRQIGAIVVKDGQVVVSTHNFHLPRPDNPNVLGDPRSNFEAGESIEISTAIHAEAAAIAEAARRGTVLEGAHVYVSTFPCPNCARLLVQAGVKKVFYAKGYSLVDAEDILKNAGVEIVMVKL